MVQKKLPFINSAHGSDTRNIINEIIKAINDRGLEILSESGFLTWLEKNGIKHRGEVATFNDLPSNDSLNTVRGVSDDNKIYIKKENGWVPFQTIDINKINLVEKRVEESVPTLYVSDLIKATVDKNFDNAPLIQNVIDNNSRGKISLPEGTFSISGIKLKSGMSIQGQGINQTVLQGIDPTKNIVEAIGTSDNPISGCITSDLRLSGTSNRTSKNGFYGKYLTNNSGIVNAACNYNGENGLSLEYSWTCDVSGVEATNNVKKGFDIAQDTNNVALFKCSARNNGLQGFDIRRCFSTGLLACDSEGNGTEGLRILSGFSVYSDKSYIEGNGTDNILIDWVDVNVGVSRGISLDGNYINGLGKSKNGIVARNATMVSTKLNYMRNHTDNARVIESTVTNSELDNDYDYTNDGSQLLSTTTINKEYKNGQFIIDKELVMKGRNISDTSAIRGREVAHLDILARANNQIRFNYGTGAGMTFYGGTLTPMMSFGADGTLDLRNPGKGLMLTSPNGQVKKLLRIDDSGQIALADINI